MLKLANMNGLKKKPNRSIIHYLIEGGVKQILKERDLLKGIDGFLRYLKESSDADFAAITVWDTKENLLYLHRWIAPEGFSLPPSKPGKSPMGICMLRKEMVTGRFVDFPGGDERLKKSIGNCICIPIETLSEEFVGAIGLGKFRGKGSFSHLAQLSLRMASNIISMIVSIKILQDVLLKKRQLTLAVFDILQELYEAPAENRHQILLERLAEIFDVDFLMLGKLQEDRRVVEPIASYGLEESYEVPYGEGLLGTVAKEKKPILFKSFPEKVPKGYEEKAKIIGSAIGVPIYIEGKPEMILIVAKRKEKKPFDLSDLYFFTTFQKVLNLIFNLHRHEEEREKIQKQRTQLEKLNALGALSAGIAHDFNNMISVISGYAQLGMATTKDENMKSMFKTIYEQCRHAANLVSQIKFLSSSEDAKKEALNLKPLLKSLSKHIMKMFPSNISVQYEDDGHMYYTVKADPSEIHSMILNLAANARDAMPEGGRLTIRLKKIDAPAEINTPTGKAVVIEIEDTGSGIPKEIIEKIFDPFFTTKRKGTGLGLTQVQKTVLNMGGTINVASKPEEGTKFTIILPEEKTQEEHPSIQAPKLEKLKGKALVVEDNSELLKLIENALKQSGLEVKTAEDPIAALELAKEPPDFLITDITLPHMSGIELAEIIKQKYPQLKVLFITGYTSQMGNLKDFLNRHKDAQLLLKPFSVQDLVNHLKKLSES